MKPNPSQIGFRLRTLRKAHHLTQEALAAKCQVKRCPITRNKLAHYELGITEVPARFIPILAHLLGANITDLLSPIARQSNSESSLEPLQKQKESCQEPARAFQKKGAPITRPAVATIEMRGFRTEGRPMISLSTTLQIPLKSLLAEWWKSL